MDTSGVPEMATALALIVGTSLALSAALGGLVAYLTESIKQTGKVPEGYSGIVALVISVLLGMALGALTELVADTSYSLTTLTLLGAFAGALMAANAVQTYKAAGDMNTAPGFAAGMQAASVRTDIPTMSDLDTAMQQTVRHVKEDPELVEARGLLRELKQRYELEEAKAASAARIDVNDLRDAGVGNGGAPTEPVG